MKARDDGSSEFRKCVTWHASKIALGRLLAILMMASLLASMSFLGSGCSPPSSAAPTFTPMIVTRQPSQTSTYIPTPTAPLTPIAPLLPPVTLEEPEDGLHLGCESPVTLRWSCPYALQEGECYQLRVKGQSLSHYSLFYLAGDRFTLPALSPGRYDWAVTVVRATEQGEYALLNEASGWRSFEIVPPPLVHSISPTCTVRGAGVTVAVGGENFTRSMALTIGVPLPATFVNTSTITATIPITLEVGEYPVIVRDSVGQGESHAFFTVSEPPTPTPVPVTLRPVYPKPVLGGLDFYGHDVTFHWSWSGILTANDYFALKVGIGIPGESRVWTKETQASWRFTEQGDYVWEVAICRGDPAAGDCSGDKELVVSERATFWFTPPPPPKDTPKPP